MYRAAKGAQGQWKVEAVLEGVGCGRHGSRSHLEIQSSLLSCNGWEHEVHNIFSHPSAPCQRILLPFPHRVPLCNPCRFACTHQSGNELAEMTADDKAVTWSGSRTHSALLGVVSAAPSPAPSGASTAEPLRQKVPPRVRFRLLACPESTRL